MGLRPEEGPELGGLPLAQSCKPAGIQRRRRVSAGHSHGRVAAGRGHRDRERRGRRSGPEGPPGGRHRSHQASLEAGAGAHRLRFRLRPGGRDEGSRERTLRRGPDGGQGGAAGRAGGGVGPRPGWPPARQAETRGQARGGTGAPSPDPTTALPVGRRTEPRERETRSPGAPLPAADSNTDGWRARPISAWMGRDERAPPANGRSSHRSRPRGGSASGVTARWARRSPDFSVTAAR